MYKIINQIDDLKFDKFFAQTKDIPNCALYTVLNVRKFTFSNRTALAWNALLLTTIIVDC